MQQVMPQSDFWQILGASCQQTLGFFSSSLFWSLQLIIDKMMNCSYDAFERLQ